MSKSPNSDDSTLKLDYFTYTMMIEFQIYSISFEIYKGRQYEDQSASRAVTQIYGVNMII